MASDIILDGDKVKVEATELRVSGKINTSKVSTLQLTINGVVQTTTGPQSIGVLDAGASAARGPSTPPGRAFVNIGKVTNSPPPFESSLSVEGFAFADISLESAVSTLKINSKGTSTVIVAGKEDKARTVIENDKIVTGDINLRINRLLPGPTLTIPMPPLQPIRTSGGTGLPTGVNGILELSLLKLLDEAFKRITVLEEKVAALSGSQR